MVLEGTARLANEGDEWLPGRDFEIVRKIGGGEGCESIVFQIRTLRAPHSEMALKQVVHYDQRREHEGDEALWRRHGNEWRVAMQLPPNECLLPVLHHYHSTQPSLRDPVWGLFERQADAELDEIQQIQLQAAATRTLFIVLPLYSTSLRTFVLSRRAASPVPPFGLGWQWFGHLLQRMLRAVNHLLEQGVVHGDIKDDQFFLQYSADGEADAKSVVLGDFGEAWRVGREDGSERLLHSPAELLEGHRRCGSGPYRPPELRGRGDWPEGSQVQLSAVYALGEPAFLIAPPCLPVRFALCLHI